MKNLRKLREACNYTQEQLANMLDTTQQTVARWETGKAEPSLAALRDLAVIFGTRVDALMGVNPFSQSVATTLFRSLDGGQGHFWGHLGVQLPGAGPTRWYPVSVEAANLATRYVTGASLPDLGWPVIPTLNNHLLMLNIDRVKGISLRRDDADPDPDDWELGWDGEGRYPLEVYRALAYSVIGGEIEASERFRQTVEDVIKQERLTPELIMERVVMTTVHLSDGTSKRIFPDKGNLLSLTVELESQVPRAFDLSNDKEGVGVFIPSTSIALVDAPLCLVLDADRWQREEYEAQEARKANREAAPKKLKSSRSAKAERR